MLDAGPRPNVEHLRSRLQSLKKEYLHAEPYPHVVIDDFLPSDVAENILSEYPGIDMDGWNYSGDANPNRQHKYISAHEARLGALTRWTLYQLNNSDFLQGLQQLTGITHLLPDPNIGQSLRHFPNGGCLGVHVDFNWNKKLQLYRRINLIIYLNKGWKAEYGGELELWDPDRNVCVRKVTPGWNRAIIFATTDRTPHGFPDPLKCPAGVTRKSIQLYYYTSAPADPTQASQRHGTVFHNDVEQPTPRNRRRTSVSWKTLLKEITPPVVWRAMKATYQQLGPKREKL